MKSFDLNALVRPNVLAMEPYSSARDEYQGAAQILLDANENPFPSEWNRYPDPRQRQLKSAFAARLGLDAEQVFLGNGSDEAIDLLFRIFCRPGQDSILTCPPTYGMYKVSAGVNDVAVQRIHLNGHYQLDLEALQPQFANPDTKLIFLCSPNNPTGNLLEKADIEAVLKAFPGIVVVDEAYVDFSPAGSTAAWVNRFPNLVVLRTFSKAWGMAGLRLGAALASREIISLLDRIKPPYNVNALTQKLALEALQKDTIQESVATIVKERERLRRVLPEFPGITEVLPSDANFLLVRFEKPLVVFAELRENGIIVRNRSQQVPGGLRLTIGTPQENTRLLNALEQALLPNVSIH